MRVEFIPVIVGLLVLLVGVGVLWDAWGEHPMGPVRERRRRARAIIDGRGESLVGLGMMLLGAALIGRDWRFETLTVLTGTVLVVWGGLKNREYIREMLLFRGAARRGLPKDPPKSDRLRIR